MHVKELLKSLLPRGSFWEIEKGSMMDHLMSALAIEIERITAEAGGLADFASNLDYQSELSKRLGVPKKLVPMLLGAKNAMTLSRWFAVFDAYDYSHVQIQDDSLDASTLSQSSGNVTFIIPNIQTYQLRAGGETGSYLASWEDPIFEALVNRIKPILVSPEFIYPIPKEEQC
jgi:hypothetical protein